MAGDTPMILIAYDGSPDGDAAVDRVAALAPGARTVILTVWQPYIAMVGDPSTGLGWEAHMPVDTEPLDAASATNARVTAERGAARARAAGLVAEPHVRQTAGSTAETILATADEFGADTVCLGTRGRTGIRSLLLGSVSHAVLQHADRAIIVVPSPEVAAERRAHTHGADKRAPRT